MRAWYAALSGAALLMTAHQAPEARASTPEVPLLTIPALDAAISRSLSADGVPGATVVLIEGGRIVFSKSYGVADVSTNRAVTDSTVFRAGSISKTLTAIGVMQLVEQRRVSLETDVAEVLVEWQHQNPWRSTHPVRVANLIEHTSGLDDIRFRHYLIEGRDVPLSKALELFGPYAVRWRPGSGTAYSNAGPVVAGRVIEKISGTDFESFMSGAVTGPMGMASARWGRDIKQADVLATSYQQDGRTPEPFVETPGRPSGSLSATALDLARLPLLLLGRGVIDGKRILSEQSVIRMETPTTSAAAAAGLPLGHGLGLRPDPNGRAVFFGHAGSIDGFIAQFAYAPALNAGYVVMANKASDAALVVASHMRAYLERTLPIPTVQPAAVSATQRTAWAGQYQGITPRQELLRAVIGVTQWEGAGFEGDVLNFERAKWQHLGNGIFQRIDASAPGLLIATTSDGVVAHTVDGTKRRVPRAEMAAKISVAGGAALALVLGLIAIPFWLRGAAKGRFESRGSFAVRLAPTIALAGTIAIPIGVLAALATGDLNVVGKPGAYGYAIYGWSLFAPLLVAAAAWVTWRYRMTTPLPHWSLQVFSWMQLGLSACVLAWLFAHGWIGIRIWDA